MADGEESRKQLEAVGLFLCWKEGREFRSMKDGNAFRLSGPRSPKLN
jgi:hypothetical protein